MRKVSKKLLSFALALVMVAGLVIPSLTALAADDIVMVYGAPWVRTMEGTVTVLTPPAGWVHPGSLGNTNGTTTPFSVGQFAGWKPASPKWGLRLNNWQPSLTGNIPRLMVAENALDAYVRLVEVSGGGLPGLLGGLAPSLIRSGLITDMLYPLLQDLLNPDDLAAMLFDGKLLPDLINGLIDDNLGDIIPSNILGFPLNFNIGQIVEDALKGFILGEMIVCDGAAAWTPGDNGTTCACGKVLMYGDQNGICYGGQPILNSNGNPQYIDNLLKDIIEFDAVEMIIWGTVDRLLNDDRVINPIVDWFMAMFAESVSANYWSNGNPSTTAIIGYWSTSSRNWNSTIIQIIQGGSLIINGVGALLSGDASRILGALGLNFDDFDASILLELIDLDVVLEIALEVATEVGMEYLYFLLDMGIAYAGTVAWNYAIDLLNDYMDRANMVDIWVPAGYERDLRFKKLNFSDFQIDIWQYRPVDFYNPLPDFLPNYGKTGEGLRAADLMIEAVLASLQLIIDTIIYENLGDQLDDIVILIQAAAILGGGFVDVFGNLGLDIDIKGIMNDIAGYLAQITNCRVYGHVLVPEFAHRPATCTEPGVRHESCLVAGCTKIFIEPTPPTGHKWVYGRVEPTCYAPGFAGWGCSVCSVHDPAPGRSQELPKRAHDIQLFDTAKCGVPGNYVFRCSYSDCAYDPFPGLNLGPTVALQHILVITNTNTCDVAGLKITECIREGCGYFVSETAPKRTHDLISVPIVMAKCTTAGSVYNFCAYSNCNYFERKDTPALGHIWTLYSSVCSPIVGRAVTFQCTREDCQTVSGLVRLLWDDPTTCQAGYQHTMPDGFVVTLPVCNPCSRSACTVSGHTPVSVPAYNYPATCTVPGRVYESCSVCSAVITDTPIAALNHSMQAWVVTQAAVCGIAGSQYRDCVRYAACGYRETQAIAALAHSYTSPTMNWYRVSLPTCTALGVEGRDCNRANCPAPKPTETRTTGTANAINPSAHNWGPWSVTTPATCTTAGVETCVCTLNPAHTDTRAIAALDHSWTGAWSGNTATCTSAGVETQTCNRAGGCSLTPAATQTQPTEALGHTWGAWSVTTPAVCEVAGVETQICTRTPCSVTPAASNTRPITALTHNWVFDQRIGDYLWYDCTQTDCPVGRKSEYDPVTPTGTATFIATHKVQGVGDLTTPETIPDWDIAWVWNFNFSTSYTPWYVGILEDDVLVATMDPDGVFAGNILESGKTYTVDIWYVPNGTSPRPDIPTVVGAPLIAPLLAPVLIQNSATITVIHETLDGYVLSQTTASVDAGAYNYTPGSFAHTTYFGLAAGSAPAAGTAAAGDQITIKFLYKGYSRLLATHVVQGIGSVSGAPELINGSALELDNTFQWNFNFKNSYTPWYMEFINSAGAVVRTIDKNGNVNGAPLTPGETYTFNIWYLP